MHKCANDRSHLLEILVEDEEKIGMVPFCPGVEQMGKVGR